MQGGFCYRALTRVSKHFRLRSGVAVLWQSVSRRLAPRRFSVHPCLDVTIEPLLTADYTRAPGLRYADRAACAVTPVSSARAGDCYSEEGVKLETSEQPHVALCPCRAIGTPSSVIEASPSRITLGLMSGCRGHETSSPLRATKRPSKRIVVEAVMTFPPWSVSSSRRIRSIMVGLVMACRAALAYQCGSKVAPSMRYLRGNSIAKE